MLHSTLFFLITPFLLHQGLSEFVQVDVEAEMAKSMPDPAWPASVGRVRPPYTARGSMQEGYPLLTGQDDSLQALGLRCGSDKSVMHGFSTIYERAMPSTWRDKPVRVLELGVFQGSSLCMWGHWFRHPEALVVGVDIQLLPEAKAAVDLLKRQRSEGAPVADVRFVELNVDQSQDLVNLAKQYGPFDIILDDAFHSMPQQQLLLANLFPFLKPRGEGIYLLEDLHTSFPGQVPYKYGMRREDDYKHHATTIQLLYHLLNPEEEPFNATYIPSEAVKYLQRDIASVQLFSRRHEPKAFPPSTWHANIPFRSTTSVLTRR